MLTVITATSASEFCNMALLNRAGDAEMAYVVQQGGQVDGQCDLFGHVGQAQRCAHQNKEWFYKSSSVLKRTTVLLCICVLCVCPRRDI